MATPPDRLSIALFESSSVGGVRLIGRTRDPRLVDEVRSHLADEHRRDLADLEPPVRLVTDSDDSENPPSDG